MKTNTFISLVILVLSLSFACKQKDESPSSSSSSKSSKTKIDDKKPDKSKTPSEEKTDSKKEKEASGSSKTDKPAKSLSSAKRVPGKKMKRSRRATRGLGGKLGKASASRPAKIKGRRRPPTPKKNKKGKAEFDKKRSNKNFNTEKYDRIYENPFKLVSDSPLSTFSIDVDTASYSNIRRYLKNKRKPPKGSVRLEELINYFDYKYNSPSANSKTPFAVNAEQATCPWKNGHKLLRIGIKGKTLQKDKLPDSNLVFLLDVSGSMKYGKKLPLFKKAFTLLLNKLNKNDRVAIVVYAGASGLVLDSTTCDKKDKILQALNSLKPGGSTDGASGIKLAYKIALKNYIKDGNNRVLLATDGDFNVGVTNRSELVRMITEKAKSNIFLTVLGFGMGNYNDALLEKIANKGNGNYAYIDSYNEARKVLSQQLSGTLHTIAKDVKIQVEFNPAKVKAYRLLGYENRIMAARDFNDDKKDAGEIGAGHMVTAIYQLVPAGTKIKVPGVDKLKYQTDRKLTGKSQGNEIMTLKMRYKKPKGKKSKLIKFPVLDRTVKFSQASEDTRFAASVAAFGMLLRDSKYKGKTSLNWVASTAQSALGTDKFKYRKEFISLVKNAMEIK
ncbi:MAG: vWA domain-containing protein [Myxococcota bacterium]